MIFRRYSPLKNIAVPVLCPVLHRTYVHLSDLFVFIPYNRKENLHIPYLLIYVSSLLYHPRQSNAWFLNYRSVAGE